MWQDLKDPITMAVALIGAILGIFNTWKTHNASKVRLRVTPSHIIAPNGNMFGISVVNLSNFPVTISEVGFTLNGNSIKASERAAIPMPIILDGGKWPRRLEPRQAVSTYFDLQELIRRSSSIGKAYVSTECGEVRYGTSSALEQIKSKFV